MVVAGGGRPYTRLLARLPIRLFPFSTRRCPPAPSTSHCSIHGARRAGTRRSVAGASAPLSPPLTRVCREPEHGRRTERWAADWRAHIVARIHEERRTSFARAQSAVRRAGFRIHRRYVDDIAQPATTTTTKNNERKTSLGSLSHYDIDPARKY